MACTGFHGVVGHHYLIYICLFESEELLPGIYYFWSDDLGTTGSAYTAGFAFALITQINSRRAAFRAVHRQRIMFIFDIDCKASAVCSPAVTAIADRGSTALCRIVTFFTAADGSQFVFRQFFSIGILQIQFFCFSPVQFLPFFSHQSLKLFCVFRLADDFLNIRDIPSRLLSFCSSL